MGNILGIISGVLSSLHVAVDALHMLVSRRVRSWDTVREIPPGSLAGKVILITGGNAGIGRQAALDLAVAAASAYQPTSTSSNQPVAATTTEIWIASRNAVMGRKVVAEIERAAAVNVAARRTNRNSGENGRAGGEEEDEETAQRVRAHFLELDLTSFASIRKAARTFSAAVSRLDILILNAGLMGGPATAVTEDGYELRFGLNYVGHALLVKLLLPLLLLGAAAETKEKPIIGDSDSDSEGASNNRPRIVALSSAAHSYTVRGGIRFDALKGPASHVERVMRYGQSKLALLLWAREMAARYPPRQVTTVSIHPGTVKTELFNNPEGGLMYRLLQRLFVPVFGLTVEDGAKNTVWAATASSKDVVSGEYYEPIGVAGNGSVWSRDRGLARKLWEWTEEELKGQELDTI